MVRFVVPCYNYGRYLVECIESIFRQRECEDFEIIAIDDGSTDNSQDILRSYRDTRVRVVIHQRNLGHICTVNEGVSAAQGAFIARIDPDDRYRPSFLASVLGKFREYPDVGLVYADAALIDEYGDVTLERSDRNHNGADFRGNEFTALLEKNFICAPTTIARREAWHSVLPIPGDLAFNDWYLNLMMARKYDFYYINQVLADYRVHSVNHHIKVIRDKTEEYSIFSILEKIYSETEDSVDRDREKRAIKKRVYATQYLTLAEKYFWFHMNDDALRCYRNAARYLPSCMLDAGVMRRCFGTIIGRERYEAAKTILKRGLSANCR